MIREALYKITENCPCNCTFCDAREKYNTIFKRTQIDLKDWIKISEDLISNGLEVAIISGGEALIEEKTTFELIKYLQSKGIYVVLNTSGVLFNKIDVLENLKKNYPDLLVFSIDSPYNTLHDANRKLSGLFDRIINAIKYLKEDDEYYPVAIRTVITKQNYKYLPKIIKDFNDLKIDCIKFTNIENDSDKHFTLSLNELKEFDEKIRKEMIEAIKKCDFQEEKLKYESINKIENLLAKDKVSYEQLAKGNFASNMTGRKKCDLVERFITIQSNGVVLPCCEAEHHYEPVLGILLESNLKEIFSTEKYKKFVDNRAEYCKKCTEWQNMQINFTNTGRKVNKR